MANMSGGAAREGNVSGAVKRERGFGKEFVVMGNIGEGKDWVSYGEREDMFGKEFMVIGNMGEGKGTGKHGDDWGSYG